MDTILIFTDAATSPTMNMSVGAFLCLDSKQMNNYAECSLEDLYIQLSDVIVYQEYESKKSTWSEIKTVIDALNFIQINLVTVQKVEIYTDCQSLCDLLGRRKDKLQKNNFMTRASKEHPNADIYKKLYLIADKFQITTFKIKGHDSKSNRVNVTDKVFDVIDKLSRKKLRSLVGWIERSETLH